MPTHQKEIKLLSVYVPYYVVSKQMRQILIELSEQVEDFTVKIRHVNSPLSKIEQILWAKNHKDIVELSSISHV